MTEQELLTFIKRILSSGDAYKAVLNLQQLREILEEQRAEAGKLELISQVIRDMPESMEAARSCGGRPLSQKELEIAALRAAARRKREEEMRNEGRC